MRCSWATSVFTCTGLNRPTRIICAIPRASLRSVLLICCAVSKAFMCRVSTQITGRSAAVNAFTSHCDSGPASIPIRPKGTPSEVRRAMISDGSVGTFCSKITLTASSTTHTDVSFTDTSRPTKCAISSLLPRCSRSPDLDPFIAREGDARSASKAEPQPPRYTIFAAIPLAPRKCKRSRPKRASALCDLKQRLTISRSSYGCLTRQGYLGCCLDDSESPQRPGPRTPAGSRVFLLLASRLSRIRQTGPAPASRTPSADRSSSAISKQKNSTLLIDDPPPAIVVNSY